MGPLSLNPIISGSQQIIFTDISAYSQPGLTIFFFYLTKAGISGAHNEPNRKPRVNRGPARGCDRGRKLKRYHWLKCWEGSAGERSESQKTCLEKQIRYDFADKAYPGVSEA